MLSYHFYTNSYYHDNGQSECGIWVIGVFIVAEMIYKATSLIRTKYQIFDNISNWIFFGQNKADGVCRTGLKLPESFF